MLTSSSSKIHYQLLWWYCDLYYVTVIFAEVVFLRNYAFFKEVVWHQQPHVKVFYYQILKVKSHKLKIYKEIIISTWKINFEIVSYLISSRVVLFQSWISWDKSEQKKWFYFEFVSFSGWCLFENRKRWCSYCSKFVLWPSGKLVYWK